MRISSAVPLSLLLFYAAAQAATTTAENPATAKAAPGAVRDQLSTDTPRTTPDGAKFIAPGGWWIEARGNAIILTPEGDSRIALVDVKEKEPDAAVKSAWAVVRPEFKWALKLATDAPGREGWDSFRNYDYEVSPNERRVVGARAAKRGD